MAAAKTKLVFTLLIVYNAFGIISPEIHRAISSKTKIGSARFTLPRSPPEEFDEESTVLEDADGENGRHSRDTWMYSLFAAGLVGLSGIFPLLVIPLEAGRALRSPANAARLKLLLSFAVGGLLGDVFLHLLPEAWARIKQQEGGYLSGHSHIGMWVVLGLLVFLLIEKAFPDDDDDDNKTGNLPQEKYQVQQTLKMTEVTPSRHHKTPSKNNKGHKNGTVNGTGCYDDSCHTKLNGIHNSPEPSPEEIPVHHIKTCGWLNLAANVIDNFTHGLAVAGSFCISHKTGVLTTAAILLHEIPHEIGDFAILLRAGFDRWEAAKAQLLTASGGLLGAFTALAAESAQAAGDRTAWVLPFTSGGFLYIALVSVAPELLNEKEWRRSLQQLALLISGISVMAVVTLLCDA